MSIKHPFLQKKHLPNWSIMNPKEIEADISEAIKIAEASIKAISELPKNALIINYKNTFEAFEEGLEPLNTAWGFISHLDSVSNSKILRKAHNKMLPIVTQFYANIPLNPNLWNIFKFAAESIHSESLTPIEKRHISETLKDFKEEGADLNTEKKTALKELQKTLAELTQKYSENCLDATKAWEYRVYDKALLKGLPTSALLAAEESAKKHPLNTLKNSDNKGLSWRFTLEPTSFVPVITYAENSALRKEFWCAYQSVGREKPYKNGGLVERILHLRHQYAQIVGRKDFADHTTSRRMVRNGASASNFIENMHRQIKKRFDAEYKTLVDYKCSKDSELPNRLAPWDVSYWTNLHQKEFFDFDEESLRPYFEIRKVLQGLFLISRKLFGLNIKELESIYIEPGKAATVPYSQLNPKGLAEVWHPDVQLYELTDIKSTKILGHFYADWHPRNSKRSGAWMNYLRTGSRKSKSTPHLGLICGNLTAPLENKPALLTHTEVETIFHEFGHLLHHLCGNVPIPSLNGVNVAWDFVELPSQIMENWCWESESLDLFARHYENQSKIPKKLFKKMCASRNHFRATQTMRQLNLAKLDLDLHRDWILKEEPIDSYLENQLEDYKYTFHHKPLPITCNFSHLFSSSTGYAAGYYSYKWAEVLDADAFTRFKNEGILNSSIGKKFKDTILSMGNSKEPHQLFEDFMGRKPNNEALLKRDGILN